MPDRSSAHVDAELRRRWADLVADAGLGDDALALGDQLIDRYREPHRHHHGDEHLLEVLDAADDLSPGRAGVVTRLAAWFHDAVYDGRAGDDETASADLARASLARTDLEPTTVDAVAHLVEATAGHLIPGDGPDVDEDTAVLLDADLSILAADPERYDRYAAGIRAEHDDIDDATFRAGRLRALRTLVDRAHLFHTELGRAELEPRARANLAREIAELTRAADAG